MNGGAFFSSAAGRSPERVQAHDESVSGSTLCACRYTSTLSTRRCCCNATATASAAVCAVIAEEGTVLLGGPTTIADEGKCYQPRSTWDSPRRGSRSPCGAAARVEFLRYRCCPGLRRPCPRPCPRAGRPTRLQRSRASSQPSPSPSPPPSAPRR